jgi:flagellar biosynthesis anti-sigma factor FlgM
MINPIGSGINGIGTESSSGEIHNRTNAGPARSEGIQPALSTDLTSVDTLVTLAMQSSPERQTKVNALQADVARGTYSVDPQEIASAMLLAG